MKNPFRVGGFEKRLVVAFLLLSVTPTVLIAFFSTRYFMRSVALVSNPAVEQSFTNSMNIARTLAARLEEDAGCTADRLADALRSSAAPLESSETSKTRAALVQVLQDTRADFAAVYAREDNLWKLRMTEPAAFSRLERELSPEAIAAAPETTQAAQLPQATASPAAATPTPSRVTFADQDIIASSVVRDKSLFVAGFALEKGFTANMRRTGDDVGRYRAVGFYVSVLRRYIIIVTCVLVALLIVASAVISRLLARRISHPITELAHATERIAKGDLEHRVRVNARDEIQSLVSDFNKMTEELLENKRNLIRAERIAAWRDFARRLAHEIKNPLTPIEIAIFRIKKRLDGQVAEADPQKDKQVIAESLDSILKEVAALKNIAQEFSAFAKLPEPKLESLNPNDTITSVLELYASSAQRVKVRTSLADGLPRVQADRDQLRSVVANLIKNAFEAMPEGGTLTVTTSLAAGSIHIEIADTGPGIPDEIKEKIFDPYFTTKSTGTGIGLALAYRILADHRAKIGFKTGETGTTFLVDLPVPDNAAADSTEETKP
jgi:nitrogen fixation/metabolism regulation signal transduction histidine kinase